MVGELEIIMKQEGELLKNKFFTHALCGVLSREKSVSGYHSADN